MCWGLSASRAINAPLPSRNIACHNPSRDWTDSLLGYLPRETQCLEDAKMGAIPLPTEVLEGFRPWTDCLCTSRHRNTHVMRMEANADIWKRFICAVCKAYNPSNRRSLPSAKVTDAMRFFTAAWVPREEIAPWNASESCSLRTSRYARHVVRCSKSIGIAQGASFGCLPRRTMTGTALRLLTKIPIPRPGSTSVFDELQQWTKHVTFLYTGVERKTRIMQISRN